MRYAPVLAIAFAAVLAAQPAWETLLRAPLPPDSTPKISVFSLPVSPAPPVRQTPGPGHTHAGPVFAYILHGEIENQVEPDAPQVYKPGGVFYEVPGHVHRFLRNLSTTEPAQVIIFEAGETGKAAPVIRTLLEIPLLSTVDQELTLRRLTLPPGAVATTRTDANPAVVYVLEGNIASDPPGAGGLFVLPAGTAISFRNTSATEPAKLLLYLAANAANAH